MRYYHSRARTVWLLGISQIIGYGTLYYSIAILAPEMAKDVGWTTSRIFAALSVGLLAGGLVSPFAGRCLDRYGPGRVMAFGSLAASAALTCAALAGSGPALALAIVAIELASPFVQYNAAFTFLASIAGREAPRRILHLTLIAGFASSLFWPLTTALLGMISWRQVFWLFAGLNLIVCFPLHLRLASRGDRRGAAALAEDAAMPFPEPACSVLAGPATPTLGPDLHRRALMLAASGFAVGGFLLSAVLTQMVPLLVSLGLGPSAVTIAALFGPAQVLVRFATTIGRPDRHPINEAVAAAVLLPLSFLLLASGGPSSALAVAFVVLLGFGSGLTSIVRGTLPLALFGRDGYGARLGRIAAAQLVASAAAPFALSLLTDQAGAHSALLVLSVVGLGGIVCFIAIALMQRSEADGQPTEIT